MALALTLKALALPFAGLELQGQGRQQATEDNPEQQLLDCMGKLTRYYLDEDVSRTWGQPCARSVRC